jgi:hypothetical protein
VTSGYDAVFGRARCYVDGVWYTPSGDPAEVVIDPFTEQPIGEVAPNSPATGANWVLSGWPR